MQFEVKKRDGPGRTGQLLVNKKKIATKHIAKPTNASVIGRLKGNGGFVWKRVGKTY